MKPVFASLAAMIMCAGTALAVQDQDPETGQDQSGQPGTMEFGGSHLGMSAGDEMMGWNIIPDPIDEKDPSTLTELEILSRSPSGVTFGIEAYDPREDNPLKPVSVTLRALNKITASYEDLNIPIGEQASFGPLTLLPRTCDKRPPEETPETTVFLEVYAGEGDVSLQRVREARAEGNELPPMAEPSSSILLPGQDTAEAAGTPDGSSLFTGWMFASSPSLNAMEHPVYDVWVIDCKMVEPGTSAGSE